MNNNDDSSREPDDALADSLRREAMAERPAFSVELHHRILAGVGEERTAAKSPRSFSLNHWPAIAAGAAVVLISGFTAYRMARTYRLPVPNPSTPIVESILPPLPQPPTIPSAPETIATSFNFGNILSANLWPPEIRINLPDTSILPSPKAHETRAAPSAAFPGSPDRLLATIQEPATSARAALADVIPPSMKALAGLFMSDH